MSYRIPLPEGSRRPALDILEPNSTAVQRFIRREGLGAYETPTAAALLAWCDVVAPDEFVLFDIGANMGLYGELAAAVFSPRAVHSFEPGPMAADVIRKITRRNRLAITTHEVALSDSEGTAELYISPISDASNSLVPGFRETDETVEVTIRTLDAVVAQVGDVPDLVKLDVETHERAVLEGGRSTIERHRPAVIVEVLRRRGHDFGDDIGEFFAPLGYHYYELSASPTWEAVPELRGSGTTDRDWLVTPEPLPAEFGSTWEVWRDRLLDCDVTRNPRVPFGASIAAAFRRGGGREVVAAARRYLRGQD